VVITRARESDTCLCASQLDDEVMEHTISNLHTWDIVGVAPQTENIHRIEYHYQNPSTFDINNYCLPGPNSCSTEVLPICGEIVHA
jgi:hypothetical protein